MKVLLINPKFPDTFWSFESVLALVNRKALMPPLGLVTVAAMLPQSWRFKLVDLNVRPTTEDDWKWADVVMLSGMIVQREDLLAQVREAKARGKSVVVGGPYATALPREVEEAGADYLVLDEGEITIPMFLELIAKSGLRCGGAGEGTILIRAGGVMPEVTITPIPRFDLLDFEAYDMMSVQFSRGCPFVCEFCDIIVLYGRRPRTKAPGQMLAELDRLYELGWNRGVFMVDDNFIGNKRKVKAFLRDLKIWQADRGYPFGFNTEASIDLAQDQELLDLMSDCNFDAVFIGIETPDKESLALTRKHQNNRRPLVESTSAVTRAGMRIMAGFIIGFDGEKPGAGERVVRFVEEAAIPTVMFSMLQALPATALWKRLEREGRLRANGAGMNQTTMLNFVPTRPVKEIAGEYVEAFADLYEPRRYLDRTYRHFLEIGPPRVRHRLRSPTLHGLRDQWIQLRALLIVFWRQGMRRKTRWSFWHHLVGIVRQNPSVWSHYLSVCAHAEHFLEYRTIVRHQIGLQLTVLDAGQWRNEASAPPSSVTAGLTISATQDGELSKKTLPPRQPGMLPGRLTVCRSCISTSKKGSRRRLHHIIVRTEAGRPFWEQTELVSM